jgi:hypothetical protein
VVCDSEPLVATTEIGSAAMGVFAAALTLIAIVCAAVELIVTEYGPGG